MQIHARGEVCETNYLQGAGWYHRRVQEVGQEPRIQAFHTRRKHERPDFRDKAVYMRCNPEIHGAHPRCHRFDGV